MMTSSKQGKFTFHCLLKDITLMLRFSSPSVYDIIWLASTCKTNLATCALSNESHQSRHSTGLIRVFAVSLKKPRFTSYSLSASSPGCIRADALINCLILIFT